MRADSLGYYEYRDVEHLVTFMKAKEKMLTREFILLRSTGDTIFFKWNTSFGKNRPLWTNTLNDKGIMPSFSWVEISEPVARLVVDALIDEAKIVTVKRLKERCDGHSGASAKRSFAVSHDGARN